jgi:DNA-binding beta-propeller fold protein YncE
MKVSSKFLSGTACLALLVTTVQGFAQVRAPELRRTAVFKDEKGERALRSPLSLVRDEKSGDLVISSFESGEVVILDNNGLLLTRLGADAGLVTPYGVALDRAGRIYVGEVRTGHLKVFSPGGILTDEIDLSERLGRTVSPGRITLGKDDRIYVADLNGNEILVLTLTGDFVRSIGKFDYLQKAGPAGGGRVVGISAQGKAVRVFDEKGTLLRSFGDHGDSSDRNVSFPTGFAVDSRGRLWIADPFQHRLKVFSQDGEFLFNFGRLEETSESGGFFFPVDLCFGDRGELFVLEKGAERVQVFSVGDLGK